MELVIWPNKVLNTVAEEVKIFDSNLVDTVDEMNALMDSYSGLGLAANQVGLTKRIIVLNTVIANDGAGTIRREFINPHIISHGGQMLYKEGCLSFPGVYVNMVRSSDVMVRAQDLDGVVFTTVAQGIDAFCLQHEIDHLNGITFYDRLSPVKRAMYKNKFKKLKKGKR